MKKEDQRWKKMSEEDVILEEWKEGRRKAGGWWKVGGLYRLSPKK
jgi:hypothetical protein